VKGTKLQLAFEVTNKGKKSWNISPICQKFESCFFFFTNSWKTHQNWKFTLSPSRLVSWKCFFRMCFHLPRKSFSSAWSLL
jgi:hypothetical protein